MDIAKNQNQNTFAKRQREMEKKRKAQDKLDRRIERKLAKESPASDPDPLQGSSDLDLE